MRTIMRIAVTIPLFVSFSFAQKDVPMPKELPPYGAEKPLRPPSVHSAKLDNGLTLWLVSEPVSYTHLDVYKRQAYGCSGLGRGWRPAMVS